MKIERLCALCTLVACACGGGGGKIQITASGEVLALGGYGFPPASADAPAFADGWEVRFDKLLATIDQVTLSQGPDTSPTDESKTGKAVARVTGPWAVDLHQGGPLAGKGGSDEQAIAVTTIENQNLAGGAAFDASTRYAFGFDLVAATATATRLNVDATDPDYAEMIQKGYVVYYVGHATWKGGACTSTNPAFDFSSLPTSVIFKLGFKSPATYVNCQNPDNAPATPLGNEDNQRGIQIAGNATTTAQVTVHTDHPFWESIVHDSPAHFDPLAALAKKIGGDAVVTLEDAVGTDYTAFKAGALPLPWRACQPGYSPPNAAPQMGFDSLTLPHNPTGSPATSLRDYADYLTYNQSTQGHLNSDGLCFVQRNYPSPD